MTYQFTPPTPEQVREWQKVNNLTDAECAKVAGLYGGQTWRKYKAPNGNHKNMSYAVWFTAVANTILDDDTIARIQAEMNPP